MVDTGHRCQRYNTLALVSFERLTQLPSLAVWKSGKRGPGIFSHVSDITIERMIERI